MTGGLVTEDASIGRLVEVTVDINESGDHGRCNSFTGTIRGTILDRNHVEYHIVETADKGCFLVGPRILGESLDWAFRTKEQAFWVGIGRILDNFILSKSEFDFSQVEYYAIGTLVFL
jgi:hypothetical protein